MSISILENGDDNMLDNQLDQDEQKIVYKKNWLSPVLLIIIVSASLTVGYLVGGFRYQFIGTIGTLFGQKDYSTSLDLSSVQETYNKLAANYDGQLDEQALIYGANRGMVEAVGDDYTQYLDPDEAIEFRDSLSGNVGSGVGIEVGLRNNQLVVIRTLKNNPAEKAGLMAGDLILKVNDEVTAGWSVEKAVGLIRGEEGTTVKLTILRGVETRDFNITRGVIDNPSVDSLVSGDIGIINVYRFDNDTSELARLAAQGFINNSIKGVIVDLRNNSGGYVNAAKDLASLWLDDKTVVIEKTGEKERERVRTSRSKDILGSMPTIILTNKGSASASEIFAGALRDYSKATLVGEKTFGKGSVQLPLDLRGGSILKVTIASWYTPYGKNINKEGIKPDIEVELTEDDFNSGRDPQLDKAIELLKL